MSDLHFEFMQDGGREFVEQLDVQGDVLIIAGDLASSKLLQGAIRSVCKKLNGKPLLYVIGNHELYHSDFNKITSILRDLSEELPNFKWLEDGICEIGGQRFVGSTLWFRHLEKDAYMEVFLNDFKLIRDFRSWVDKRACVSANFLKQEILPGDVVITHHLPSPISIHPMYVNSSINRFFLHDMTEVIEEKSPILWIHGHTHSPINTQVKNTRIICNPLGYVGHAEGDFNSAFNHTLCVEI